MRCGEALFQATSAPPKTCSATNAKHQGYFTAHSRSKSIADVADSPLSEQEYDNITYISILSLQDAYVWTYGLQVNGLYVSFKVDTGAKVTVISEDVSKALGLDALQPPTKKLHGPDHSPSKSSGKPESG